MATHDCPLSCDAPELQSHGIHSTASIHFAVNLAAGETWILCTGMQSTNNRGMLRRSRCGLIFL